MNVLCVVCVCVCSCISYNLTPPPSIPFHLSLFLSVLPHFLEQVKLQADLRCSLRHSFLLPQSFFFPTSPLRLDTGIVYLISVYMADGATCNLSGFILLVCLREEH